MESLALLNESLPTLTQLLLVNMPEGTTEVEAKRKGLREIMNMEAIFSLKPELGVCEATSIVLAVKQCIADNLTLAPAAGLVYLYPQKVKVGTDSSNATIYKNVLVYDPTAEGRISIARQSGSILDHKRPKCEFDHDGKVESVSFTFLVPSFGGARWETVTFTRTDFEKWQQKSAAKFSKANANYTSWKGGIDPEFAGSKAIRHALKKLGTNKNEIRQINYQPIKIKPIEFDYIEKSAAKLIDFNHTPEMTQLGEATPIETKTEVFEAKKTELLIIDPNKL